MRPQLPKFVDDEAGESASSTVRQLARERGVSERTVWRWMARIKVEGLSSEFLRRLLDGRCVTCGRELPEGSTMGRRYCPGSACRVAAFRAR